ncbi:zf-HC2 domain-containing protein [Actinotalea solisilvae]|uniref:zf-HC2 domain-containing protein n=1 Tax=Actinotalea solisilvae TaxID=2072922 RepID=UPI0018F1BEA2|nr:zf-HC2 domain-containing protein [Actinotalea solisilvae]
MSHLGSQISALVDGQLPPAAAERVLAHAAACRECADELAAARAARRALAGAADVPVDPGLTARLVALGAPPCDPSARGVPRRDTPRRLPDGSLPMPGSRRAELPGRATGCLGGDLTRSRTPARVLATAAGVGVVAATLVALGVQPAVAPSTHPAHALTLLSRAGTGEGVTATPRTSTLGSSASLGGTATTALTWRSTPTETVGEGEPILTWLGEEGWSAPDHLPEGYAVTTVRDDVDGSSGIEVDLAGPLGTIVVTEQHGRLDPSAVAGAPLTTVGERSVHLLSSAPWHVVWQSGSTVVSVVAETRTSAAEELVTAYPHTRYDDRVAARLARGWDVIAGAWGP